MKDKPEKTQDKDGKGQTWKWWGRRWLIKRSSEQRTNVLRKAIYGKKNQKVEIEISYEMKKNLCVNKRYTVKKKKEKKSSAYRVKEFTVYRETFFFFFKPDKFSNYKDEG